MARQVVSLMPLSVPFRQHLDRRIMKGVEGNGPIHCNTLLPFGSLVVQQKIRIQQEKKKEWEGDNSHLPFFAV